MTNRNYQAGRRLEHDTVHDLTRNGYEVMRSAGSKGVIDIAAFKPGQVLLVQAKTKGVISPAERAELLRVAAVAGAVPVVVTRPRTTYRRLTGVGPHDWTPWTPDEIGEPA